MVLIWNARDDPALLGLISLDDLNLNINNFIRTLDEKAVLPILKFAKMQSHFDPADFGAQAPRIIAFHTESLSGRWIDSGMRVRDMISWQEINPRFTVDLFETRDSWLDLSRHCWRRVTLCSRHSGDLCRRVKLGYQDSGLECLRLYSVLAWYRISKSSHCPQVLFSSLYRL